MLRALACCWTAATTALSVSISVPALRTIISSPRRRTAASDCWMLSRVRPELLGFTRTAIRVAAGRSSRSNSSRLATSSVPIRVTPVTFPSGRLRLGTKPAVTGSEAVTNTIGDRLRCRHHRPHSDVRRARTDDCNLAADEVGGHSRQPVELTFRPAVFDPYVPPLG